MQAASLNGTVARRYVGPACSACHVKAKAEAPCCVTLVPAMRRDLCVRAAFERHEPNLHTAEYHGRIKLKDL